MRVSGTFGFSLAVSGEMPEESAFVEFRILNNEFRIFFIVASLENKGVINYELLYRNKTI